MVATTHTPVQALGRWAWEPDADRWRWDDDMFAILGYRPGEVLPSTDLLLSHHGPASRPSVSAVIESVRREPRAFSTSGRIHPRRAAASTPVRVVGHPEVRGRPTILHGWVAVLPDDCACAP